MRGGGGGSYLGGKRRWKFLAIGVLFLVVLSMLVPFVFLLGIYNRFHSTSTDSILSPTGYLSDQPSSSSVTLANDFGVDNNYNSIDTLIHSEDDAGNNADESKNNTVSQGVIQDSQRQIDIPVPPVAVRQPIPSKNNTVKADVAEVNKYAKRTIEENQRLCEVKFGSYCLWHEENREDMKDLLVKKLKDQLFVARAYFPSIAKLPAQNKLSHELKQNIQELERVLSESTTDNDLPPQIEKKLEKMEAAIAKAKTNPVDCNNVDKKLRQIFDLTEDEANFHMKQSAFLYQLAVQTKPKSLHCLSMKLTVEYFRSISPNMDLSPSEKLSDASMHHYVLFSSNMLASSVVINSTVMHAMESGNLVFHVLTDRQNYFAMKLWFFRNTYKKAAVEVLNVEDLNLEYHDTSILLSMYMPVEFRVSLHAIDNSPATYLRTEYLSVFSPAHYLLPYIFPNLKRVVVLDDDVVVQRDLSELWSLNMGGKVNGALQLCSVQLRHLNNYFGGKSFNKNSCAWMSGLNVIDMVRWKELDLTETFRKLRQKFHQGAGESEAVALGASLLTFQDLIYALDNEWALSGMGHDYGLDAQTIKNASILHYNGKMKPWLELGIPKYKQYWKRFLNREDQFLGECNVNP